MHMGLGDHALDIRAGLLHSQTTDTLWPLRGFPVTLVTRAYSGEITLRPLIGVSRRIAGTKVKGGKAVHLPVYHPVSREPYTDWKI